MPLTTDLRPGKFIPLAGANMMTPVRAPKYNGTLNTYAPNNPNSTLRTKVFERDSNGHIRSQNDALIEQEYYDASKGQEDLQFALKNRSMPSKSDVFELISDIQKVNYKRPKQGLNFQS